MFNKILLVFLLTVLPFGVICQAQEQAGSLNNFTGNNTVNGIFGTKITDSRIAHNVDFNRAAKGTICPRFGFDSISHDTMTFSDSIIDIFTLPYSDGTERLLVIIDTPSTIFSAFGTVSVTPIGSTNLDSLTRIESFFPISGDISAILYRDVLYLSSSTGRGLVWDGTNARKWPLSAPGEPSIIPLERALTGRLLKGEYRYVFLHKVADSVGTDTSYSLVGGYITRPVRVEHGMLMLRDFPEMAGDSNQISKTTEVMIYRTKGDVGRIDGGDYAYYIGRNLAITPDDWSFIVDTLYDDSLPRLPINGFDSAAGIPESVLIVDGRFTYVDTLRYGSGTLAGAIDTTTGVYGINSESGDSTIDANIRGWAYTFAYVDTILGLTSDTSRSMIVLVTDSAYRGYAVNIPRTTFGFNELMVSIFRAPLITFTFDTAIGFFYGGEPCEWTGNYIRIDNPNSEAAVWVKEYPCFNNAGIPRITGGSATGGFRTPGGKVKETQFDRIREQYTEEGAGYISGQYGNMSISNFWITPDSLIVGDFHKIGMVASAIDTEVVFVDTAYNMNELRDRPLISLRYVPPFINQMILSNNRLYGLSGDGVFYSHLDSISTFGVFSQIALSVDDGEDVNLIFESRNLIRAFKETSNYNLWYEPGVGLNQQEVSFGLGCVAPRSYAPHATGHYFLSNFGVVREGEGDFLERRQKYDYLSSGRLGSFDDLTAAQLDNASAVIFDDKYMLSIGDTTYVYDIIADTWSTWSMTFKKAVVYRDSPDYTGLRGDNLFFIGRKKKNLYQYAVDNTDTNSVEVTAIWRSVELQTDRMEEQVSALGLWVTDTVKNKISFSVKIFGADTSSTSAVSFDSSSFAHRYLERQMPYNLSKYFQIQITTVGDTSGVGIMGIEPIITKQGLGIRK